MTRQQLAADLGVDPDLLAEYEAGVTSVPLQSFCSIMTAMDQDPVNALASLQQRLSLADLEPKATSKGQMFLASGRGRQIINALAMCDRPEALDALADLILSMGIHSCVNSKLKAKGEPVQPNEVT